MTLLSIISLPYPKRCLPHFAALSDLTGFALLDSSASAGGRYDIVSAYPYDEIVIPNDAEPSFETLKAAFKAKMPNSQPIDNLPFQGGGIGYIAYDFGARAAGIETPKHKTPLVDIKFYDWAIVVDHLQQTVSLVSGEQTPKAMLEEVSARWHNPTEAPIALTSPWAFSPQISREAYRRAIGDIKTYLKEGRMYQVNYTQPFVSPCTSDPWQVYQRVREHNPVPYAAFLQRDDTAILSFSPERFLTMDGNRVVTSPIKGTARRVSDTLADKAISEGLQRCEKNRAENIMIVDLLRNDLGQCALPGSVTVPELCGIHSFEGVHHLVSQVEAVCEPGVEMLDLLAACFPGGSITGAPKREAMRIINELEQYARSAYCGTIGYFSVHGRMDTSIAIRTATVTPGELCLPVGGGIVIDSAWEAEYEECLTKIKAIVDALG